MKKTYSWFCLIVLFVGCSSTYHVSNTPSVNELSFDELRQAVRGEDVTILLATGETVEAAEVQI